MVFLILLIPILFQAPLLHGKEDEERGQLSSYLIPEDHKAKKVLDKIFGSGSPLKSSKSLKKAGFIFQHRDHENQVIIAAHPKLDGYLVKLHLDSQTKCCDRSMCLSRVVGARLIEQKIVEGHFGSLFKVPKKWIYLLPEKINGSKRHLLVVEDLHVLDNEVNLRSWQSTKFVTEELLRSLFSILDSLGMCDLVYVDNIPFSLDRKLAFIDTENANVWPVPFKKLTGRLPKSLRPFWKKLIRKAKKECLNRNSSLCY